MLGQLRLQRRLDHRLGQTLQQPARADQSHTLIRARSINATAISSIANSAAAGPEQPPPATVAERVVLSIVLVT
jgi:hypothetical protein